MPSCNLVRCRDAFLPLPSSRRLPLFLNNHSYVAQMTLPSSEEAPADFYTPSGFQLALALAVAKSKPGNLSIRGERSSDAASVATQLTRCMLEYLTSLRDGVTNSSIHQQYGSYEKHFNAIGFWKAQNNEARSRIQELEYQNMKLEERNVRLSREEGNGNRQSERNSSVLSATSTKRGHDQALGTASSCSKKKTKTEGYDLKPDGALIDEADALDNTDAGKSRIITVLNHSILTSSPTGSIVVHHLYRAHKSYQQIEPDPAVLAYHLSEAASHLAQHIATQARHLQKHQLEAALTLDKRMKAQLTTMATARARGEMQRVLNASGRSFASLFVGLEKLWSKKTEAAHRHHGAVTYKLIQTVDSLLSTMASTCKAIANQEAAALLADSDACTAASKPKQTRTSKSKEVNAPVPYSLAMFIRTLLEFVTPARGGAHAALFEGVLYHLLDRTGKRLFALTFQHERSDVLGNDIKATPLTTLTLRAIHIEAKLLVEILDCAMRLAPVFVGSLALPDALSKKAGGRPGLSSKASVSSKSVAQPKATLSIAAKEKLQATLIHCMFGDEVRDNLEDVDDDDTEDDEDELIGAKNGFMERLRKPVYMAPPLPPPKVEEEDVPQWFREEVWRMVGWDLLGKIRDW
jgi:hypothetical protein